MSRKRLGIAALLVAACALGAVAWWRVSAWAEEDARRKEAEAAAAQLKAETEARARLEHADLDMARLPKGYPRPVSAWRSAERTLYSAILGKARFEVLVVPFQVQDHAFSRSLRSLMAAKLAAALADAGESVADPYVTARALGDGERRFDLQGILSLGNAVDARRIVVGYVGHDGKGSMRLTLHAYERPGTVNFGAAYLPRSTPQGPVPSDLLRSRHFESIAFSDTDTPLDAFDRLLPAALKFLGADPAKVPAGIASTLDLAELPQQPSALWSGALAGKPEPARDAYYLQLLAILTPVHEERAHDRFAEKSLLAVGRMSADSPDYRALKARALLSLGLRPAALAALGTPASAEEKHLRALLQGDLAEVRANLPAVPAGVRALIAELEANQMLREYGARDSTQAEQVAARLRLPGEAWSALAKRAILDLDYWAPQHNLELKARLDREFPQEGSSAEAMLRGAQALGGDARKLAVDIDLAVLQHVRRQAAKLAETSCCRPSARAGAAEYLDLLAAVGADNVMHQATFLQGTQGLPRDALDYIAARESGYKDHPGLALIKATAQLQLAGRASEPEKARLHDAASTTGFNLWYWEQGQSYVGGQAVSKVVRSLGLREYRASWENLYAREYPYRADYTLNTGREDSIEAARAALAHATIEIYPLRVIVSRLSSEKKWDELDALLGSLGERFRGHPARTAWLAESSVRKGDLAAAERAYREGIAFAPENGAAYSALGALLFMQGAPQRAFDTLMSYPGMKDPAGRHPVAVAAYTYEAGSTFYLTGYFKEALPFYKLAAALDTGSDASLSSATRLALLAGAWQPALAGSLQRARRYESPQAYRDYLGLLHVMGHSKEAWAGFTSLLTRMNAPQLWETALVGHRLQGATPEEIAEWAAKEPMNRPGGARPHAQVYLLRSSVTDRMPPKNLTAMISAADPKGGTVTEYDKNGTPVTYRVPLVYFAEGYGALRRGDFDASRAVFQEALGRYPYYFADTLYLLPYYAYAAARAKNTADVQTVLGKMVRYDEGFDYQLARAALAGVAGKTDEALAALKLALHRRVLTGTRPVYSEYQYAEMCELLFDATRDARYRELALDWARKVQQFQPWHAWSYAIEARYTANAVDRRRAIAMAYYLDRGSERLGKLPPAEVKAAVKAFAGRNPFLRTGAAVRPEPI